MEKCKKCLLLEAGESVTYNDLMRYVGTLDRDTLAPDKIYKNRIEKCRKCDFLISGMCLKCGCYVEVRARLKESSCPNADGRLW